MSKPIPKTCQALIPDRFSEAVFQGSGSHFDPDMVEPFLNIQKQARQVAMKYADSDEEKQTWKNSWSRSLFRVCKILSRFIDTARSQSF